MVAEAEERQGPVWVEARAGPMPSFAEHPAVTVPRYVVARPLFGVNPHHFRFRTRRREIMSLLREVRLARAPDPRRFCIFSLGRSGTQLLVGLLNGLPGVTFEDEILGEPTFFSPHAFVRRRAKRFGTPVYGFKLIAQHPRALHGARDPGAFVKRLADEGWRFITVRRSVVDSAVSEALVFAGLPWHLRKAEARPDRLPEIDVAALMEGVRRRRALSDMVDGIMAHIPHLAIDYDRDLVGDAAQQRTVDAAAALMGVPTRAVAARYTKATPEDRPPPIANLEAVRAALRDAGVAWRWA